MRRVGGGTHWSLLAYLRGVDGADDAFLHFDSLGGANASAANALAAAAAEALGGPRAVAAARNVRHDPPGTPRQTNGYDCGVYVLEVADAVCDARGDERRLRESLRAITPERVAARRAEMLALVERLAEEASGGARVRVRGRARAARGVRGARSPTMLVVRVDVLDTIDSSR